MRHRKKLSHLGRKSSNRKSMLANMGCSLIEHKRINTTISKAKALKQFIEPIITKSKLDSTHNRRLTFKSLRNKFAVSDLFRIISPKVGDRPGGYTRIIKLGNRLGDNAEMAMIELVDFNSIYSNSDDKKVSKTKGTRRSRSKKSIKTSEISIENPNDKILSKSGKDLNKNNELDKKQPDEVKSETKNQSEKNKSSDLNQNKKD